MDHSKNCSSGGIDNRITTVLLKLSCLTQQIILLLLRLHWGWLFYVTGSGKLQNHDRVVGFFTSLGIPFPEFNAWFVGAVECFGGLLILAGLFARPVGAILSINMLVAYLTADRPALLAIFSNPETFTDAAPFFFLFTALMVFAFGAGVFSLDFFVGKIARRRRWWLARWGWPAACCPSTACPPTACPPTDAPPC